jgi:hypothetical protein
MFSMCSLLLHFLVFLREKTSARFSDGFLIKYMLIRSFRLVATAKELRCLM